MISSRHGSCAEPGGNGIGHITLLCYRVKLICADAIDRRIFERTGGGVGKRILVTGGTGFIGSALCAELAAAGYEVVVLSRSATGEAPEGIRRVRWDARSADGWRNEAEGAAALINLAGDNIGEGRWTEERNGPYDRAVSRPEGRRGGLRRRKKGRACCAGVGDRLVRRQGDEPSTRISAGSGFLLRSPGMEDSTAAVENLGVRRVVLRTGWCSGEGNAGPRGCRSAVRRRNSGKREAVDIVDTSW